MNRYPDFGQYVNLEGTVLCWCDNPLYPDLLVIEFNRDSNDNFIFGPGAGIFAMFGPTVMASNLPMTCSS